jgi:hypothetical protein
MHEPALLNGVVLAYTGAAALDDGDVICFVSSVHAMMNNPIAATDNT